jgi:hypothetical protein
VFKVYAEYCGSVIVDYKYNGSLVDVDGVLGYDNRYFLTG